jgi:benzoate-CoA ligase
MLKHPAVLEAAVVGAEEASGLVKTFVFVAPRDQATDPEALIGELRQLAESSLPAHERPREIRVVRELPRTDTGKLKRFQLKEEVQGRR